MTRIEHVNITVPDIDEAIRFLKIIAPDFEVRKDEKPPNSYRWVHIGNEAYYIALQEPQIATGSKKQRQAYQNYGINHVALVVTNIQKIEKKLLDSGYSQSIDTPIEKHRKRAYYYDKAGFEWELVEYLSEKPSEKYFYE